MIDLGTIDSAFTQGGNRLCFSHPTEPNRCIKIIRPDRTPAIRRKGKSFPKNLRSLRSFDENWNEFNEVKCIDHHIGAAAFTLIPRCYGIISTNLGAGLCSDMIVDDDGKIAISLKQYLWVNGFNDALEKVLESFTQKWVSLGMPSRDLLLHNIVVQQGLTREQTPYPKRLVVIDGLGWSGLPLLYYFIKPLAKRKAQRKIKRLQQAIKQLLYNKEAQADWGYHGWMNEEQRRITRNEKVNNGKANNRRASNG